MNERPILSIFIATYLDNRGGRPLFPASIRTTTRKCTAIAKGLGRNRYEVLCNRRWRSAGT